MANIKCIYCGTSYNVDTSNFKDAITKFRCANCKKVFAILSDEVWDAGGPLENEKKKKEEGQDFALENENNTADSPYIPDDENNTADSPYIPDEENKEAGDNPYITDEENKEAGDNPYIPDEESKPSENLPIQNDNPEMGEIFERLNKRVEEGEQANKDEGASDDKTLKSKGVKKVFNFLIYLIIALAMTALCINYYKYEITRKVPMMEMFFKSLGLEAKVLGEGLEFINVEKNFFEDDYVRKMEIKGYISNTTENTLQIPAVYASLLNEDATLMQEETIYPSASILGPNARISFRIVMSKPSPYGKYVYLTFIKDEDAKKTKKEPL